MHANSRNKGKLTRSLLNCAVRVPFLKNIACPHSYLRVLPQKVFCILLHWEIHCWENQKWGRIWQLSALACPSLILPFSLSAALKEKGTVDAKDIFTVYPLSYPFSCKEQTLIIPLFLIQHLACCQGLVCICDCLSLASTFFQSVTMKNFSPRLYCFF